jgi:hypothetical protein
MPARKKTQQPAQPAETAVQAAPEVPEDSGPERLLPLEPESGTKFDARMSLTLAPDQKRLLDLARVDDGTEGTARIRAMIALYGYDPRVRKRIDRIARNWR